MANSIKVTDLCAGYGAVQVLNQVALSVGDGETVTLLGTNGNGKSTLIKSIMGIVRPTSGKVEAEIDGKVHNLVGKTPEEIVRLGVALVPEGRRLFPKLTVEENLLLGAYRDEARARIAENLDFCYQAFSRLAERRNQLAGSMSGGEQQMVALARAVMTAPKILLIDEPSVGLAPILVSRTIEKIGELKEKFKLTVLMAEQNFHQAVKIADRGYVIVHGHIEFEGKSREDMANNEMIKKLYLGI
ncbi:MAG TPA: ABC transporter ATP-binding protein [Burkholderiales bacterium]